MAPIKYLGHTVEQERDGSFSVYHPIRHYRGGHFKSIAEALAHILRIAG